jgi:rhodanese-related sulfurtransferase
VNESLIESPAPDQRSGIKQVLLEAALIGLIGAAVAFAANEVSPRGLSLSWNYFGGTNDSVPRPIAARLPSGVPGTNPPSPVELMMAQLKAEGLRWVNGSQALELSRDPRRGEGKIVFVDARNQQDYQSGHIASAYEFDPYDRDKYEKNLLEVLPVCQMAEQVVVYCQGGECDASELAARYLAGAGVAREKLFVYLGGITEWCSNSLPTEIGLRNSGNLSTKGK